MARRQDPEHELDPLLRRMLRTSPGESTPGCLDADTLAAWADRTLRRDEVARVEQHAADCGRCRAMLAAFVRSEVPAPMVGSADGPVVASFWRRWRLQWLMPVAAAATAVAVYIAAPEPPAARPERATTSGRVSDPAPAEPAAKDIEAPAQLPPPPASPQPAVPDARSVPRNAAEARSRFAPVPQAQADAAAPERAELGVAAPAAAAAASAPGAALESNIIEPAPPAAATAAPAADAAAVAPSARAPGAVPAPAELKDEVALGRLADAPRGRTLAAESGRETIQWRLNDGRVERSVVGGAWRAISLPAGVSGSQVSAIGTAGAQVVWLVGRAGLVLVSSDGSTFQRTVPAGAADLVSVQARSGRSATVVSSDGRQYNTEDGGSTWTPR